MSLPNRILVVDDNQDMARGTAMLLRELPAEARVAHSVDEACSEMQAGPYDLVVSDIRMPERDGMDLLDTIVSSWPRTKVIMLTAYGSIESAVEAMKRGACDYVTKPFNNEELSLVVRRALRERGLEDDVERLRSELESQHVFEGIVSRDARMLRIFDAIRRIARSDATVLVQGENGTGKELIARAVHRLSGRTGPFVAFNAAAVPEGLVESELFGCRRGAFTGADRDRKGHFLEASQGTLFIDEVSSTPASLQAKLLRALQEHEVLPVGSSTAVPTGARIVASTNIDLLAATRAGKFREDLFYRLSVVRIQLPSLMERIEDVALLANHFAAQCCRELAVKPKELSSRAVRVLLLHEWPGNVRELQNVIHRAVLFSTCQHIEPEHILFDDTTSDLSTIGSLPSSVSSESYGTAKRRVIERFQRQFVERALAQTHGNIAEASRRAGITRAALHRMIKRLAPLAPRVNA